MAPHIWLRTETKNNEARCPLTPNDAKKLIDSGFKVSVEQFASRIFTEGEYHEVGCEIVKDHTWMNSPKETIILGLKELPENEYFSLTHRHIFFAHAFKGQNGSKELLTRFKEGGGSLYDLEYLTNDTGHRISAFGKWAGYVGAAIALDRYYQKQKTKDYTSLKSYSNKQLLLDQILKNKERAENQDPKVIIIGSKGRCGSGAAQLLKDIGVSCITSWDKENTIEPGPYNEIINHNIFINTVLVTQKVPPFIDRYTMNQNKNLEIIADISCDPTSDLNPIPLYSAITSWKKPFCKDKASGVEILAVDNLPSVLPRESSEDFSEQLLPYLIDLKDKDTSMHEAPVWRNAFQSFNQSLQSYF